MHNRIAKSSSMLVLMSCEGFQRSGGWWHHVGRTCTSIGAPHRLKITNTYMMSLYSNFIKHYIHLTQA
jgi:hypothetical protein